MSPTLVRIPYPKADNSKQKEKCSVTNILEPQLMFSGRAADTLVVGRQAFDWKTFTRFPRSDLGAPRQVFVDAYGFVQICPGIAIGNACEKRLKTIIQVFALYERESISDLAIGCCLTRREIIDRFPELLGSRYVYCF